VSYDILQWNTCYNSTLLICFIVYMEGGPRGLGSSAAVQRTNLGLAVTAKRRFKPKVMTPVNTIVVVFLSSQISQKGPKNAAYFWHSNAENLSASGGFSDWPGALPLDHGGGSPCVPHIGALAASAPGKQFLPTPLHRSIVMAFSRAEIRGHVQL